MNTQSLINYLAEFPESLYQVSKENKEQYVKNILLGIELINTSKVFICGIARNIGPTIKYTIPRIERLGSYFRDYDVYIFENDSTDQTAKILDQWRIQNKRVGIEHETLNVSDVRGMEPERLQRMAYCRNKYLDVIKWIYADFIIVLDMDIPGGWSYHGIFNSFGYLYQGYSIIASNSIIYKDGHRMYYDAWAYRRLGHEKAHQFPEANTLRYNRGESPFKVHSAFGGLAIYKAEIFKDNPKLRYTADDCDHPTLHKQIEQLGQFIYLNPSQITLYNEHEFCI